MAGGVEVGCGLDDRFGAEGFGAVVAGEEVLDLADEFLGAVGGDFVAVDLEFEALAKELGGEFRAESLDQRVFVREGRVAGGEGDEHFLIRFLTLDFHGAGDFVLAVEVLEVKLLRPGSEFMLLELEAAFDGFKFACLRDDLGSEFGDIAGRVWQQRVVCALLLGLGGDASKVDFLDSRCGSGGWFGFCGCWHGLGFWVGVKVRRFRAFYFG